MIPLLLKRVEAKGYRIFTRGQYNLNIISIRHRGRPNEFDDIIALVLFSLAISFAETGTIELIPLVTLLIKVIAGGCSKRLVSILQKSFTLFRLAFKSLSIR